MAESDFNPAFVIPVYDHEHAIRATLLGVLEYQMPVLLVDDGSSKPCQTVLEQLADEFSPRVSLLRLDQNRGKGGALKAGFRYMLEQGFTHGIQIDADGQHDVADLPGFLQAAEQQPQALIAGYPEYDESVPKVRYYGRYLTHVWVWINTLSFSIRDTMCGFRLYPLAPLVTQFNEEHCGDRMDFDTEVLVRWYWRGGLVINQPVNVRYPLDGVSHFDVWRDNVLITVMHSRLFFGMLRRLPGLIWRKFRADNTQ
ncbi:glycosyltransferase family 2 protein [Aliamphritea spongicola]|uniref:glycosyltransferase family 2 protein n=1 Tax=Aliamphritea spongicola TaxID=707589 RepID=UPI00196B33B4|nr:glycosyltransferase family 2 protein [Aliamphritea spongicola]MBN3564436.1 glycosyltransferase family 2 protein [Aliamphritea spongicola]